MAAPSVTVSGISSYSLQLSKYWGSSALSDGHPLWYVLYKVPNGKRIVVNENGGTQSGGFTRTSATYKNSLGETTSTYTDPYGRSGNVTMTEHYEDGGSIDTSYLFAPIAIQSFACNEFTSVDPIEPTFSGVMTDGLWWGKMACELFMADKHGWVADMSFDYTAAINFDLSNTSIQYELPSGFTMTQFFEVLEKNVVIGEGASPCDRNRAYWVIKEPAGKYITGYTVYYQGGGSTTHALPYGGPFGAVHAASGDIGPSSRVITRIVFTAATGYRVRVRFTGQQTANGTATIGGDVVTEKVYQGGERVVVKFEATEPSRIYRAKLKTIYGNNATETTYNLPGRVGSLATCTSTSLGSSRYRDITCTINSIDRSYEFTVPLETLYNLTVQNDTGWYVKTKKEQYYAWANSSAGTSGGWYFFPQNRNSETRTRVAAAGDDLVFSAKTGDNDSIIYQILDASGGVLLTNTAKAAEVSVPLIMPAGNLTVRILARLKTCKVEQFWWGPWAEYASPSQALISAKYPGIELSTIHGAGDADYGDRVEIYPQPAQGFLSFGMCEYEYDPTVADDALHTLQVDRNRLRSPDVTQAAPYVIGAIEVPVGVIFFYGTANLQIVLATVGGGTVSGGGAFLQGAAKTGASPFTLTATPDAYYRFDHWEYKLTKRYTYDAQAAGTWGGVGPTVYPVVGREIVDDTVAGQQATLTLDPTVILDGIVEITAVFVLANPGQLLYGANGRLLFGTSGALLYQG